MRGSTGLQAAMVLILGTWGAGEARSAEAKVSADAYRRMAGQVETAWQRELDLWFPRCVDQQQGGFHPHFREDWTRGEQADKTIVFQSRMTWVCAQVALRYPNLRSRYLEYTRHGVDFLEKTMWDQAQGGFFWGLDAQGKIGPKYGGEKHVYGIAFALYGLSAAYEASRDDRALKLARKTFAWLEQHAHDPVHGGYHEALTRAGEPIVTPPAGEAREVDMIGTAYGFKSMNSHIHLLEALTALQRVWPEAKVQQRLREVFAIVRDKIAVEPGCLNLYFTPDWRSLPDHDSFGHDIETAYLLIEAAEALHERDHERTWTVARSLVDHALRWGWDERHGGFYDKGSAFHPAWAREKIWWTQAEGLNALLLMHERFGHATPRYWDAFVQQWNFIAHYQVDPQHGGWYESVSDDGKPKPDQSKGTIWKAAYHNGRALMNVAQGLKRLAHEP